MCGQSYFNPHLDKRVRQAGFSEFISGDLHL